MISITLLLGISTNDRSELLGGLVCMISLLDWFKLLNILLFLDKRKFFINLSRSYLNVYSDLCAMKKWTGVISLLVIFSLYLASSSENDFAQSDTSPALSVHFHDSYQSAVRLLCKQFNVCESNRLPVLSTNKSISKRVGHYRFGQDWSHDFIWKQNSFNAI